MPLTAFSISAQKEEDVGQILRRLSAQFGEPVTAVEAIPETWRAFMRQDLQCPCCFVTGSDLVKEALSRKTRKPVRQACFRFSNPKHRVHCDFDSSETANSVPENLVSFGDTRTLLTKSVRELVGTGIELGLFSQRSIRDMREWFFNKKIQSMFLVSLDPRFPKWIDELHRETFYADRGLPVGVAITPEIVALPGFSWRDAAARVQLARHPQHQEFLAAIRHKPNHFFGMVDRLESLAKRHQGRLVFDPTSLESEYKKTCDLANFIVQHHKPLRDSQSKGINAPLVLAFAALLLFVRGWDISLAISDFAKISAAAGHSNQDLGNVMGLNPFHDCRAFETLKAVQEFNILVEDYVDLKAERLAIEQELRAKFGAPPVPEQV